MGEWAGQKQAVLVQYLEPLELLIEHRLLNSGYFGQNWTDSIWQQ